MKKLISLILTLALLSTVFGTVAMAKTTETVTSSEIAATEMIIVTQKTADNVTTQTVEVMANTQRYSNLNATSYNRWAYLKFPIGDFESITAATLKAHMRLQGNVYYYVLPSNAEVWANAERAISNGGTLTEGTDTLLERPDISDEPENVTEKLDSLYGVYSKSSYGDFDHTFTGSSQPAYTKGTIGTKAVTVTGHGGNLVSHLDKTVKEDSQYLYIAIACYAAGSTHYGYVYKPERFFLTLTGERSVAVTTSLDDVDSVGTNFTYTATVGSTEGSVYMVVGVYDENDTLLGAKISKPLALGTDTLSLDVDTSAYATADYIKAYLWDSSTLEPYMASIQRPIA